MTFQERCKWIGQTHAEVIPSVFHYFRAQQEPPYAIWQEDGADLFYANNQQAEYKVSGTTDYFTQREYDPMVDQIQDMLTAHGFAWAVSSIQYEPETNLIHYEWKWEV